MDLRLNLCANPISWQKGKIDAFIAGLAYIDIGRRYWAWQGGMRGGLGRRGGGCVDKEVRHGLGAAPLIRSWCTIRCSNRVLPPLIRRSSPVKLLSRPNPALVSVGGGGALKKGK